MKKWNERKLSLADAVSEAFGDLQGLGDEMREWEGNISEKFSNTEKYSQVSEAADTLESLNEVDVPDTFEKEELTFNVPQLSPRQLSRKSRADRRDDATMLLDIAIERLNEIVDDEEKPQDYREAAEALRDELDNAKGEAEGVEFPGMY